jgi:hypothetical protein
MRGRFVIMICLIVPLSISAQVDADSIKGTVGMIYSKTNVDSLQEKVIEIPEILYKLDSIRTKFNLAADSLQTQYQDAVIKIDAEATKLKENIDSLHRLSLPATREMNSLDSLNDLRRRAESEFASRFNNLKAKTTDKLNAFDLPPEYQHPLGELTKKLNDLNLDTDVIKIPQLKMPNSTLNSTLPEINGIGDLTSRAGQIGKIDDLGELPTIETPVGDLREASQHVEGYQAEVKNITQGNLNDITTFPENIEEQATKIKGLDELQKQSGILDGHKASLDQLKNMENAKQQVVTMAKKAAVDHFAGKQEQLKAAMEEISKYKQKFASASSIKDLPKRPPNAMKGKPFVERLVPGLYFQYQQKNFYLIDVNPYFGYKISGTFITGLGWNHRYAYGKRNQTSNLNWRIFGPRGYVDVKLGKGFIAHLEGECMNAFVPSTLAGNPGDGEREWVWSFMTGLKKEYKLYKNLKGIALIQYNWFNRYYKAPYLDRFNSKIGFEYTIKKVKREKAKTK